MELNDDVEAYRFEPHFHNQLKALLLQVEAPTQIIRESTIAPNDFLNKWGKPRRRVGAASEIAWNLSATAFYKSGARPWKLADVRGGVCYLGVVFKRDDTGPDLRWASCGAQMFLDSGDGLVFRGTPGRWYSEEKNSYHLDRAAAKALVETALSTYTQRVGALTKLNYNACIYGDGEPVTLKFADAVGEILTAGPTEGAPLPFRLYI